MLPNHLSTVIPKSEQNKHQIINVVEQLTVLLLIYFNKWFWFHFGETAKWMIPPFTPSFYYVSVEFLPEYKL